MHRTHRRGHGSILKQWPVHVAGFNLGLVMRKLFGIGKPRRVQDGLSAGILPVPEGLAEATAAMGWRGGLLWRIRLPGPFRRWKLPVQPPRDHHPWERYSSRD